MPLLIGAFAMFALKGALITPLEIIKNGAIVVTGNKIKAVGPAGRIKFPPNADIIDYKDNFIAPGFIDLHVQGAGGCDILDGNYEAVNTISKTLARYGTTAFLATTVIKAAQEPGGPEARRHLEAVKDAIGRGTGGATVLGVHLEGPFVNPAKRGMIKEENIVGVEKHVILMPEGAKNLSFEKKRFFGRLRRPQNDMFEGRPQNDMFEGRPQNDMRKRHSTGLRMTIDHIIDVCNGSLKMMTIAPELPGVINIIKRLRKNKIVASIGHTDASYDEAIRGFDAGITHATHMFNAMSGLHHRKPNAAGAILADERISVQLIADGRHLHPAVVKLVVRQKGSQKVALITDSMSAAGLPDGNYMYNNLKYEAKDGLAFYCAVGATRRVAPTFIGTALTLNQVIKRIIDMGAATLEEAVRMASLTPAEVLGIDNKKGSLEAGKDADIVVMDKDCNVKMTMVGGRMIGNNMSF